MNTPYGTLWWFCQEWKFQVMPWSLKISWHYFFLHFFLSFTNSWRAQLLDACINWPISNFSADCKSFSIWIWVSLCLFFIPLSVVWSTPASSHLITWQNDSYMNLPLHSAVLNHVISCILHPQVMQNNALPSPLHSYRDFCGCTWFPTGWWLNPYWICWCLHQKVAQHPSGQYWCPLVDLSEVQFQAFNHYYLHKMFTGIKEYMLIQEMSLLVSLMFWQSKHNATHLNSVKDLFWHTQ